MKRTSSFRTVACLFSSIVMASVSPGESQYLRRLSSEAAERSNEARCIGLTADFSKLKDIQTEDLDKISAPQGNRMFSITSEKRITRADGTGVLANRMRLEERIAGIKIRGANAIVNFKVCESGICPMEVESLSGKTFDNINVDLGYVSNKTKSEAIETIKEMFDTTDENIGELSLEVFATTNGDHLSWSTDVIVENNYTINYVHVSLDAHSLGVLSMCNLLEARESFLGRLKTLDFPKVKFDISVSDSHDELPRSHHRPHPKPRPNHPSRHLQDTDEIPAGLNGISCGSCAEDSRGITWSESLSSCQINTLYLHDEGRETTCLEGTNENGEKVFGAGPVPSLHWEGTQDCKSTTDQCQTTILPTCSDSISDIQYGAIKTMQYFQDYLGLMGGLKESANDPVPIKANAHYNKNYCNAFYRYSANTVFFGDCDCSFWSPLTTIDIVAHEIAHGVTRHSSGLEYQYQSGGMNEAFSDIVGAVLEFMIDDEIDRPDFDVGEMLLGNKLRSMEFPEEGGRSIRSVCQYESGLDVHHTSGPLNKAYVKAVRACEASGCSDLKQCTILLGSIFMYSNIQLLTPYSGYLDGAAATCSMVDEYFAAMSPTSSCPSEDIKTFVKQGWSSVDVVLDISCQAANCCDDECTSFQQNPQEPTSPNAPQATIQPTATSPSRPPTLPTPAPTMDPELSGSENVIARIFKFLQNLYNLLGGIVGGQEETED